MRKHLTAKAIEGLKPAPSGKRYDVADAIVPGFGVRVNDKGRKSSTLTARFGGSPNPTRRTIAEVGAMELAMAREIARAWLVQIDARSATRLSRLGAGKKIGVYLEHIAAPGVLPSEVSAASGLLVISGDSTCHSSTWSLPSSLSG